MEKEPTPIDVNDLKPCVRCGKGLMHSGVPIFYQITVASCVVDVANVSRLHGLQMAMGGAAPLAFAFAPDTTVARRVEPVPVHFLCHSCALEPAAPLEFIMEEESRG